jgi:hypothetical protein
MLRNSLFFVLVFFFGCHSSKQINSSPQLLFSIEKGPCFGACPHYKVEVYADGTAYYYGYRNVDKLGEYKIQLSSSIKKQIKEDLSKSNLEKLDTSYVNRYLTDFPAIDLYFDLKSERKHIHIFHQQPPQEISDLLRLIDGFENAIDWKNTN